MELIAHLLIMIQGNMWNVDVAHIDQYSMLQKLNKLRYSCCLAQLRLTHSRKLAAAPRAYSFQMRQHLPRKQVSAVLFSVEKSSRIRCYCIHGLYFFFKFTAWKEVNLFCESYFIICPSPNHRCGCFQSVPPL